MARMKLMTRKHVRAPLRWNAVPMESRSNGQNAGYFPRTLWTVLLELGYSEPPTSLEPRGYFVGTHTFGVYVW
jgi:hypothetical protein